MDVKIRPHVDKDSVEIHTCEIGRAESILHVLKLAARKYNYCVSIKRIVCNAGIYQALSLLHIRISSEERSANMTKMIAAVVVISMLVVASAFEPVKKVRDARQMRLNRQMADAQGIL